MIELTTCKFHLKCLLNESQYINDNINTSIKDIKSNKLPDIQALYSCREYISKMKDSLEYVLKEIEKEYDRQYTVPTYKEVPVELPLSKEYKPIDAIQQTIGDLIAQAEYEALLPNCPVCNHKLREDAYFNDMYCEHCGDWLENIKKKGGNQNVK